MKFLGAFLLLVGVAHAQWVEQMENENPTATFAGEDENAEMFVEGDMTMTKAEYQEILTGEHMYGSVVGRRWPNPARIPYVIDSSLNNMNAQRGIKDAIADYKLLLNLQLVPRTSEAEYINFGDFRRGCSSPVGWKSGRRNDISLVNGCWHKGTIMHEIAHSLGLYHEQSRPDRDSHVTINVHNIIKANVFNFNKMMGLKTLGTAYDFGSLMHYGKYAFSKTHYPQKRLVTIETKNGESIGQRNGLSPTDQAEIQLMYPCLPYSCGGPKPNPSCKDLVPSATCKKSYVKHCNSPDAFWNAWTRKYCTKSCGFCSIG